MSIPVATTEFTGTLIEILEYGIYLVVFPQCLAVLKRKYHRMSSFTVIYFLATMIMSFILITLHLIVDIIRLYQAFTSRMSVEDYPTKFYANVDTGLNLTKNATWCSVTLLADMLLIYRTWVVWGHRWWIIVVPLLIFGVDIGMSVWFTWSINRAAPGNSVLASAAIVRSKYFYVATLVLNVFCTVVIAFKIWGISRAVKGVAANSRGPSAMSIILESAAIYTGVLIILIGTAIVDNSVMFFFINSMPTLIGSVFSYIILRSATDIKRYDTTILTGTNITSRTRSDMSRPITGDLHQRRLDGELDTQDLELKTVNDESHNAGSYPQPGSLDVHVHLEQVIHHDSDQESDRPHSSHVRKMGSMV
jgi:hypothetical protein